MYSYSWGVNGYGAAFVFKEDDKRMDILFCTLPGVSGAIGAVLLDDQAIEDDKKNKRTETSRT